MCNCKTNGINYKYPPPPLPMDPILNLLHIDQSTPVNIIELKDLLELVHLLRGQSQHHAAFVDTLSLVLVLQLLPQPASYRC